MTRHDSPRSRGRRIAGFLFRAIVPIAAILTLETGTAHAVTRAAYSMEILVNGVPLDELAGRGTTYVEAIPSAEYSIRLSNRTGERVAIALAVDGLNSIDAKATAARDARKWILGPWETIVLDGWQTSSSTARRFYFTTERDSYGAWLGKTKNLGIVSAAVFREKRVATFRATPEEKFADSRQRRDSAQGAPAAAPSAERAESDSAKREQQSKSAGKLSDEMAATGIGRELDHQVRRGDFDAEDHPAAVLDLRYEYHDALVRLGVLPQRCESDDALARRERAKGYDDLDFAPDPYRRRR